MVCRGSFVFLSSFRLETPCMRTLTLHFADDALPT
jgi:hypothetical protein